ncbi:dihydroorotase [Bacteroidales bacterium OttesenSCG-928-K03]|nr:dihydroorotase [Bacteroidales bacterium OttesenSCG-928-L14]MDL2240347.1 dihydroorotase [Bacteroidales bacterium OttesenSCG-928-K22]MDL2242500.1 dihydroorotase [Bacteroidales bacterium OttesenSCG-928-K03]
MKYILRNANVINEGKSFHSDILLNNNIIEKIDNSINIYGNYKEIVCDGFYLLPGLIDDQVHFREPGLTHKADIYTESMAAVAGGVTSYMEMPNTKPQTTSAELLEEKYQLANGRSFANYSFYIGATNDNLDELKKINPVTTPGVKVFMGSSTGNMLVDNNDVLEKIFSQVPLLIAIHAEDENIIQRNTKFFKDEYGDNPPFSIHPLIRTAEACFECTSKAVDLAKKHGTRLHILHLTTALEANLLSKLKEEGCEKISSEVCTQHLWFTDEDYKNKNQFIKWNPAIKTENDRNALREALKNNLIDVIATDHAPHTIEEKNNSYYSCPSGGPMVQHSLLVLLEMVRNGIFDIVDIPKWTAHNPSKCFRLNNRGFIREGFAGDVVIIDPNDVTKASNTDSFYKCKWSPFDKITFNSKIKYTFVNSNLVYDNGKIVDDAKGERLFFEKP